jgi:hypothetical protein
MSIAPGDRDLDPPPRRGQATFTVRSLAEALRTESWRLTRIVGVPGGIPASRARGAGSGGVGRGGQWRIDAEQLLSFVRVPESDWPENLEDPAAVLDKITLLSKIASDEKVGAAWARNVWARAIQVGAPYGRWDALLPTAVEDKVRQKLNEERGPAQ